MLGARGVDRGLLSAATELFECGHYSCVVAVCSDALAQDPDDVEIRLLLARALAALRQDAAAEVQLGHVLQRDTSSALAYHLLGEIALRRNDLASAVIYFREAVRLDPGDLQAREQLERISALHRPTAAVGNLPATTVAVGRPSKNWPRVNTTGARTPERRRHARGSSPPIGTENLEASRIRVRGFGRYLVEIGAISPMELHRVLTHHRATGLRVGEAAVALGYLTRQHVEWAAMAYHHLTQRPN